MNQRCLQSLFFLFLLTLAINLKAQDYNQTATIEGRITDATGKSLELVNIAILDHSIGASTNRQGQYKLIVPAGTDLVLMASFVGFEPFKMNVRLKEGEKKTVNIFLKSSVSDLPTLEVEDTRIRTTTLSRIDPRISSSIVSLSGGAIESLVKSMPGVSSNNELSNTYSVRGGNYDENLVYVNDIEIYRPLLLRSGQQEGLSFLNSDMVASILFSAGGFEAKYGDKMSSVLDIKYKKPTEFAGSVSGSLLGATAHLEGTSPDARWTYIIGVRQKSNSSLLGSLDTKGEYRPSFTDLQGLVTFDINEKLEISFLGNYSRNIYKLVPSDRETDFGSITESYRLKIYFDGQESDKFINYMGALSLHYKPNVATSLRLTASAFHTNEQENYDLQGQYWIGKLETDLGSDNYGNVTDAKGIGTYLNHARNELTGTVLNLEHRGAHNSGSYFWQWGLKWQHEKIEDNISEWTMIDSAGFSIPDSPWSAGEVIPSVPFSLNNVAKASSLLESNRFTGFLQSNISLDDSNRTYISAGLRFHYWDVNEQFLASPRITLARKPRWTRNVVLRLSAGLYYQPPFYREIRDPQGILYPNTKAQASYQFVAGADMDFTAWNRPFKFTTEAYYKKLDNLIPYEVDNVRIKYLPQLTAKGYAVGIDFKVNGEFVKGVESWASLSLMKTEEDIIGDSYYKYYNSDGEEIINGYTTNNVSVDSLQVFPGNIPRPSDQRFTFNLFFQDYLPGNPTYKMHLNLVYGSSLPFGPPNSQKYQQTLRIPAYRRVDIGFSKLIKSSSYPKNNWLKHIETIWITAEVFNLLQFHNTVSYLWVTDVSNRKYAIPNYLTPRQLNIKLQVNF